jgi:hypothetical protein
MVKFTFLPDAKAAFDQLKSDPTRAALLEAILRAFLVIRREPGSAEARREAWRTEEWGQVWVVPVRAGDDDWFVVWREESLDEVLVLYLGPEV